jgi:hypothetical protein
MTVNPLDRVAHMKSIKRHEILMPRLPTGALTSIKSAGFCAGREPWPAATIPGLDRGRRLKRDDFSLNRFGIPKSPGF